MPADLPATPALTGKLGTPSLTGFKMTFANSPVGLIGVDIEDRGEQLGTLEIRTVHSFRPSKKGISFATPSIRA